MNYRIAPEAQQDIADIWHFIAQDGVVTADQVIDVIKSQFHQIAQQPELGRAREDLVPGLRSVVVRRYRRYLVFYKQCPDEVKIVPVLDGSRDLKQVFKR